MVCKHILCTSVAQTKAITHVCRIAPTSKSVLLLYFIFISPIQQSLSVMEAQYVNTLKVYFQEQLLFRRMIISICAPSPQTDFYFSFLWIFVSNSIFFLKFILQIVFSFELVFLDFFLLLWNLSSNMFLLFSFEFVLQIILSFYLFIDFFLFCL